MLTIASYGHDVGITRMRIGAGAWDVTGLVAVALLCVVTGRLPRSDAGSPAGVSNLTNLLTALGAVSAWLRGRR